VQLHGYQPPSLVRALKAARDLVVVKVLHVLDGECLERALVPAYTRAGVDVFLLDTATSDGRLGSTARSIDPAVAAALVDGIPGPVMVAGGLSADSAARFRQVVGHLRFHGIDVDGGARGADGRLDPRRVEDLRCAWEGVRT
jgi:phosphoribosylanthranilate isomerase